MWSIFLARKDPLGVWLLKWVVLPMMFLFFVLQYGQQSCQMSRAATLCKERGYVHSFYVLPGRYDRMSGKKETCRCWGKIQPDGSIDESDEIRVSME